ncbi:MAG: hypothetical protein PHR94_10095 [Methylomonas lenta]|nr:hypothetical protein [Methylomonas lenta]
MRNAFLTLILLVCSLPASAQAPMIEAQRPSLITSSSIPLGDLPAQTDDLATTLAVCLFIICVYFLYWLKQKA